MTIVYNSDSDIIDIYIVPKKPIKFISLNFVIANSHIKFEEIVPSSKG